MAATGGEAKPTPWRVHVSGLAKTVVHRKEGSQCYDEESTVGDFFFNRGCAVTWVSLLVDKRSNRSRGFAFVDFDDEESFKKACALNGAGNLVGMKLDEKSAGRLQVSPAKPSEDVIRNQQLELTQERDKTEGLEKSLRLVAVRINEKMQLIQAQRARQLALQDKIGIQEALEKERMRQGIISAEIEELNKMEASLGKELRAETERTQALEDLHASVDSEHLPVDSHAGDGENNDKDNHPVKPRIEPEAEELHRTISRSFMNDSDAPPPPDVGLERAKSWLQRREEREEDLKRAASMGHIDISRGILDGKMEALERAASTEQSGGEKTAMPPPRAKARWGDLSDSDMDDDETASFAATSIWGRGAGRTDVHIKNLPKLSVDELKAGLEREMTRLWELTDRSPPVVQQIRIWEKDLAGTGKEKSIEARVNFNDQFDAWLLVEHFGGKDWSNEFAPTLHGRVLQVDWPPRQPQQPPPDFRALRHVCRQADTDASSQISYNTIGTAPSLAGVPIQPATSKGAGASAAAYAEVAASHGNYVPPQNRTVILSGIPTMMKDYDVKKEILALMQRLYQKKGFVFDPQTHLHRGLEGMEVRAPSTRKEENGGSVKLRLRNCADAIWLVEQASRLKIADVKLRAIWAQPRSDKGTGKGGEGRSFADVARRGDGKIAGPKGGGKGGY
mmetsp:Transcript_47161/g.121308  ORF Transcript_47161/g.121308 Transcript_47161/m.121308 type:complete len:677 (-) Transcript_47161:62-2092(-)